MNSFERFNAVLNHKKPDKVPFYYPTISCTVASDIMGKIVPAGGDSLHFKEELSLLKGENAHKEFLAEHHEVTIELNRLLRADLIRETWRSNEIPTKMLDENTLLFESEKGKSKVKRFYPETQSYGVVEDGTKPRTVEELKARLKEEMRSQSPKIDSLDLYNEQLRLKKMAKPYFPAIFNAACPFISIDDPVWLMATILETDFIAEYLLYRTEIYVKHLAWAAENGYKFILGGSDIASNSGAIISPEYFGKLMLKPLQMISKTCEDNELMYCYRSDGSMWLLMEMIFKKADIGAFGEVDRDAGMTVAAVKEKYPNLIILGNVSSAVLHKGSTIQVRTHVKAGLQESGSLNYIAGPSNMIMPGTPADNVWAMVDEINNYV